ncbi:MAG: Stp1/IreP family PP2C-type Ser/Thr phosphatase [Gemmatimonadetes bacterium]|nr:Stp1/IreP family PP2C-type Ser/Thr phosphatase [Gemmatimonadota bacterium]
MKNPTVSLEIAARTDLGRTRDHNEDTYFCADLSGDAAAMANRERGVVGLRGALFLVADGMGGAAAGEIASAMAAETIAEHLRLRWSGPGGAEEDFIQSLREAVEGANDRIHAYAGQHPDARGMGTTATVAGVLNGRLHLAQVGDSRAYLVRRGGIAQLTKDQSLMQRLIDAGELTEEQAAQSERRNIILQALGPDPRIRMDITYQDLARGDTLILCSDGLSGQLTRAEIGQIVGESPSVADACDRLISAANDRGGPDNITVVVVKFGGDLPESTDEEPGYHAYPVGESSGEAPAVDPEPSPLAPEPPAPVVPAPRTGSPVAMAAAVVAVLLVLLVLFLLIS